MYKFFQKKDTHKNNGCVYSVPLMKMAVFVCPKAPDYATYSSSFPPSPVHRAVGGNGDQAVAWNGGQAVAWNGDWAVVWNGDEAWDGGQDGSQAVVWNGDWAVVWNGDHGEEWNVDCRQR